MLPRRVKLTFVCFCLFYKINKNKIPVKHFIFFLLIVGAISQLQIHLFFPPQQQKQTLKLAKSKYRLSRKCEPSSRHYFSLVTNTSALVGRSKHFRLGGFIETAASLSAPSGCFSAVELLLRSNSTQASALAAMTANATTGRKLRMCDARTALNRGGPRRRARLCIYSARRLRAARV